MGFSEILLIFLLGFLLFGPRKTSELARQVGQHLANLKRSTSDLQAQLAIEMPPDVIGGNVGDHLRQAAVGVLTRVMTAPNIEAPATDAKTSPPIALVSPTPPQLSETMNQHVIEPIQLMSEVAIDPGVETSRGRAQ